MKKVNLTIENGTPIVTQIKPVEVKGQRVLTTEQLGEIYEVEEVRIRQGFSRNQDKFQEGKHYFKLQGEELKQFKREYLKDTSLKLNSLMLWTERGANRHCKILDTDKAWEQFDNLEETYFRVKNNLPKLSRELQAILMLDNKTMEIEEKVTNLENNIPLFNVECKELQALVRKTGIKTLGGYKTQAYNDRSLRTKVYTDIQHQLKREFGVTRYEAIKRKQLDKAKEILVNYTVPVCLKEEIFNTNNQEEWRCI
ncbi:hypothetical protein ACP49_09180 [Clostridium botulinum]|uniref:ORF6C domain-containing protein n=1 Tax=Clostridium botulinum TaxID=1491 RepID=UPI0006A6BCA2|nr:ORF6C domain-containing protein [Clostridium botulinum]KOM97234.1 hypothetical protein ACP53_04070 [Clostridium botulinum]KON00737.1 hypothetical protein ACP49_09180 [Clostridium botulinum]MBY7003509.1 ORF6C domain-containing protein [Clostridium botulinum]MCR1146017.1 ORF6C domain-containing protein [Clostridium botulinum]NFH93119.1 hypothetical protein [Clostridium botulinum]